MVDQAAPAIYPVGDGEKVHDGDTPSSSSIRRMARPTVEVAEAGSLSAAAKKLRVGGRTTPLPGAIFAKLQKERSRLDASALRYEFDIVL